MVPIRFEISDVIYGELDVFEAPAPGGGKEIITGVVFIKVCPRQLQEIFEFRLGEWLFEYHFPDPFLKEEKCKVVRLSGALVGLFSVDQYLGGFYL